MHVPQISPILSQDSIQAWIRSLITDWLSRHNQRWNKDIEIHDLDIKVNSIQTATNIPECMSIPQLQQAMAQDDHLQWLKGYVIVGWPENRDQMLWDMRRYQTYQDNMVVINGITKKNRHVVIPKILKTQTLNQLHVDHMGIEKTKLLACKLVYWVNINLDIENHIKLHYMPYISAGTTEGQDNSSWYPSKTMGANWCIGADIFTLNNKHYLCITDYHSKFPIIKKTEDLSADSLILKCKFIFAEYGLPNKIMSGSGSNFISDKFKTFCMSLNIE